MNLRYEFTRLMGAQVAPPSAVLAYGSRLVYHFLSRCALLGFNQKLDPDEVHPSRILTICTLSALCLAAALTTGTLQLGLLLIIVCPLWLYAFPDIDDIVMENRAYLAMPGIGLLAGSLAVQTFWLTVLLACIYAALTFRRNIYWGTRLRFWEQASQESPGKLRPIVNYAVALSKTGSEDQATSIYKTLVDSGSNRKEIGLCASNLSILYMKKYQQTQDKRWIELAAELLHGAGERWPTHPRIHYMKGALFMGFRCWEEAIECFSIAIENNGDFAEAWRERARCWGQLGNGERAQADADKAESIDGIKGVLRFRKRNG